MLFVFLWSECDRQAARIASAAPTLFQSIGEETADYTPQGFEVGDLCTRQAVVEVGSSRDHNNPTQKHMLNSKGMISSDEVRVSINSPALVVCGVSCVHHTAVP